VNPGGSPLLSHRRPLGMRGEPLEVWLDGEASPAVRVGTLSHDRGQVRFRYEPRWLQDARAFALDPDLTLGEEAFFPKPELGNFGIFLDSSPDRWGQMLMKRREALLAHDQGRAPRTLYAWDYLIGVQDLTRQGALRFRREGEEAFLGAEALAAPPVTSLAELEAVATQITAKRMDDLDALKRWLAVLVAPGASLGGARPKANFRDSDGSLWIGKFPSRDDERDVGAWEFLTHTLATQAGIDVPAARLVRFKGEFRTFCVQRFDRRGPSRRFYASAMTLLRHERSEGASYLELAQFLRASGDAQWVEHDLAQLFRRVLFNVAVGNRDDHLRNHGFILGREGWRLSPAFDVNPNVDKAEHVLAIDDTDPRPSLATVLSTAGFYGVKPQQAQKMAEQVCAVVGTWRALARRMGLSAADIAGMAAAFSACPA
jgi:serine/threonine-protein kinase HipA